jgi:hypothetical protein
MLLAPFRDHIVGKNMPERRCSKSYQNLPAFHLPQIIDAASVVALTLPPPISNQTQDRELCKDKAPSQLAFTRASAMDLV